MHRPTVDADGLDEGVELGTDLVAEFDRRGQHQRTTEHLAAPNPTRSAGVYASVNVHVHVGAGVYVCGGGAWSARLNRVVRVLFKGSTPLLLRSGSQHSCYVSAQ